MGDGGEGGEDIRGFVLESGTVEHPKALDAIEAVLERLHRSRRDDVWATFTGAERAGEGDAGGAVLQVSGQDVNLLMEEVDLAEVLERGGAGSMVGSFEEIGHNLYRFREAGAGELAVVVDVVMRVHFGLSDRYWVHGLIEG